MTRRNSRSHSLIPALAAALVVLAAGSGCSSRATQTSASPAWVCAAGDDSEACPNDWELDRTEPGAPDQVGALAEDVWFTTTTAGESRLFRLAVSEPVAVGSRVSVEEDGRLWVTGRSAQRVVRVDAFSDLRGGSEFGADVCLPERGCAVEVSDIVVEPGSGAAYLLASFHDSPAGAASVVVYDYFQDAIRLALPDVAEPGLVFIAKRTTPPTLVIASAASGDLVGIPTLELRNTEIDAGAAADALVSGDYGMEVSSMNPGAGFCGVPASAFDRLRERTTLAGPRHCIEDGDAVVLGRGGEGGQPMTEVYRVAYGGRAGTERP